MVAIEIDDIQYVRRQVLERRVDRDFQCETVLFLEIYAADTFDRQCHNFTHCALLSHEKPPIGYRAVRGLNLRNMSCAAVQWRMPFAVRLDMKSALNYQVYQY